MKNIILLPKNPELEKLSRELGFEETLFLSDVTFLDSSSPKTLMKEAQKAQGKKLLVIYKPVSEELLRFALEKAPVDIVFGLESLLLKDSLHYVKSGLDPVLCQLAAKNHKKIGFSFSEIVNAKDKSRIISRMGFNLRLCKKYGVDYLFSNFSLSPEELRSAKDIRSLEKVIFKRKVFK